MKSIASFCFSCTSGGGLYPCLIKMHKTSGPFYVDFREIRGPGVQRVREDFRCDLELPGTHQPHPANFGAIDRRNSRFQAKTPQKHRKMQEKRCKTPVWASHCVELPIGKQAQNGEGSTSDRCRKRGEKLRRFLCFFGCFLSKTPCFRRYIAAVSQLKCG